MNIQYVDSFVYKIAWHLLNRIFLVTVMHTYAGYNVTYALYKWFIGNRSDV